MFLLSMENICLQKVNISGKPHGGTQCQPITSQKNTPGKGNELWVYTQTDKDDTGLEMIWHDSGLRRSDAWAPHMFRKTTNKLYNVLGLWLLLDLIIYQYLNSFIDKMENKLSIRFWRLKEQTRLVV